ncbi:MAG: toxin-antitoxin system HicB family antitoxin [Draconibacterium sp.]
MEATKTKKKQTAFRFNNDLLERLKVEAKKENRSLNNYVESVLMDALGYRRDNPVTLAAIEEAKAGKYAGVLTEKDLNGSLEDFIKAMEG